MPVSAAVTDSAGLWLTPPLQRTKNMPTSVIADITTASCPAPLVSSIGRWPQSLTAWLSSVTSRGAQWTAAFSPIERASIASLRRLPMSRARDSRASVTRARTASCACRTSSVKVADAGITLATPGSTCSLPTVATSPSWVVAAASAASTTSAAAGSAFLMA